MYGVVSQVGAGAAPERDQEQRAYGNRWVKVQMVGEGQRGGRFERGISQYPTIEDRVHIVTEADLLAIYGSADPQDFVTVGHLASAESIPSLVNINKLVTRHCAIVGTTGSGKSTTVAGLLTALSDPQRYPSARIVVLDIHGEYARALADRADVFRVGASLSDSARELVIPYWALSFQELVGLVFGLLSGEKQIAAVSDKLIELKRESLQIQPRDGIDASSITVDSPVPFCLHKLWFDLHKQDHETIVPKPGAAQDEVEPAYVLRADNQPLQPGDAMTVTPPLYRTVKSSGPKNEQVQWGKDPIHMRQQLAGLASRLRDPRLAFLFSPGDWQPDINGQVKKDLDSLLEMWIGGSKPIAILDLSGIPSSVLNDLIGTLLRILYDAIFWARNLPEGGRERPLFLVLEEAHAYLSKDNTGSAAVAVRRIAKEGRKYGVGMMIVSQRPSEIDSTILSQCGTLFAMRLANDTDRGYITSAASDNLKGLFEMLPVLRTGEAVIVGEAVSLPIRTLISPPLQNRRPDSVDPKVAERLSKKDGLDDGYDGPGSWVQCREPSDYAAVVRQWRLQKSAQPNTGGKPIMDWISTPESSNIARFAYDEQNLVLKVDFIHGGIYDYFDVPIHVFEGMRNAASKGQYLAREIKGTYRYART